MAVPFLDLARLHNPVKEDLLQAVEEVINSNAYILGPSVSRFEQHFAEKMGAKHAIGVNSGTDALLMTMHALGLLNPGDEIICPVFTFVATADVIVRMGQTPVFVDITPDYVIDVEAVRAAITERTRAVIAVHLFGRACDMTALQQLCNEQGLYLIEDVCQACGAEVGGKKVGTFGIAGCFSFYPTKNLGGFGDGGLVLTDNDDLAQRLRLYRDHGRDQNRRFVEIGYNSRLDALQAALLDIKLGSLDEDNADRIANAAYYNRTLNPEIFALPAIPEEEGAHVFNLYTIRHPQRDLLRNFLRDRQVDTAIYYDRPLHLEPCFEYLGYTEGHFPVAEQAAREVLSLPVAPGLTKQELGEVTHAVDLFAQTYSAPAAS